MRKKTEDGSPTDVYAHDQSTVWRFCRLTANSWVETTRFAVRHHSVREHDLRNGTALGELRPIFSQRRAMSSLPFYANLAELVTLQPWTKSLYAKLRSKQDRYSRKCSHISIARVSAIAQWDGILQRCLGRSHRIVILRS